MPRGVWCYVFNTTNFDPLEKHLTVASIWEVSSKNITDVWYTRDHEIIWTNLYSKFWDTGDLWEGSCPCIRKNPLIWERPTLEIIFCDSTFRIWFLIDAIIWISDTWHDLSGYLSREKMIGIVPNRQKVPRYSRRIGHNSRRIPWNTSWDDGVWTARLYKICHYPSISLVDLPCVSWHAVDQEIISPVKI